MTFKIKLLKGREDWKERKRRTKRKIEKVEKKYREKWKERKRRLERKIGKVGKKEREG